MSETIAENLWGRDGSMYQTRVKRGHFRIHIFWRGDRDPDMHDHPADFWTFPLVSYVEEVQGREWNTAYVRVVRAFRPHWRHAEFRHRVLGAWDGTIRSGDPRQRFGVSAKPVVTIGWWSKKRRDWGFWPAAGFVPWRQYVNEPGWATTQEPDHG